MSGQTMAGDGNAPRRPRDAFLGRRLNSPSQASTVAALSGDIDDKMERWMELHRRRMELLATLRRPPQGALPQEQLFVRQAANRLCFDIDILDRQIRQTCQRYRSLLADNGEIQGKF